MPRQIKRSLFHYQNTLTIVVVLSISAAFISSVGTAANSRTEQTVTSSSKTAGFLQVKGDASPSSTPVPSSPAYDIAPTAGRQGKEYEVVVTSNECVEDISQDPPTTNPRNALKDLDLYAPDGSGIKVTNSTASDCRVTAKLSLANDAPLGIVKLWLINKKTRVPQMFIDFAVTGITAGPIPPGLNGKGQVDVMWSVLPDQVVHDNFGAKVATEYFCIDAVIGNDSGYDIQIASIGFTVPTLSPDTKNPRYRVPNTGYRVVRGTLQRRELLSPRNLILNGIKVAGPLLTGFLPFFHNMVHTTNFSEFINIISNPLEKGFESAVPDTVPFQVNRLDDQTFRDDIATRTVIPNNIQTRVTTFVPKELVFPGGKGGFLKRRKPGETSKNAAGETADRHKPKDVMQMLGDIVIIGEQIEHVNRIRVVSTGLETQPADRSISGKITDLCLVGVSGVTIMLSAGSDFISKEITTSPDGTYTFENVPIGRTYTVTPKLTNMTFQPESPGSETFTLNDTKTNLNFRADYEVLTITGKVIGEDGNSGIAGAKVTITGDQIIKTWTCASRNVDLVATKLKQTATP